jgi:hypothetical protein
MGPLGDAIKMVIDAAPHQPGVQTNLLYILFNLAIPITLGFLLTWITKLLEKGLTLLLGERR